MSAPHADDRDPARPEDRRNGRPVAGVLDGPVLPRPRQAPRPGGPGPGGTVPGPRAPGAGERRGAATPPLAVPGPVPLPVGATGAPPTGPALPGATELTGPVDGARSGPHTPPMPWPAVPAAVPRVHPGGSPPERPARRRALDAAAAAGTAGIAGAGRLAGVLRGTVGHRTAALAVGATFVLAVGAVAATSPAAGPGTPDAPADPVRAAPVAVPPDLVAGTAAADPAAFAAGPTFASPSGNIACRIDEGGARCDVENQRWDAEGRTGCDEPGLTVGGAAGAREDCAGDPVPSGGPELGYGTHLTRGAVTCVSRRTGVECRDAASGHGFTVARAAYRTY